MIELGASPATGPTFIAQTDNEIAVDYELAKAVLDRIMPSLEETQSHSVQQLPAVCRSRPRGGR